MGGGNTNENEKDGETATQQLVYLFIYSAFAGETPAQQSSAVITQEQRDRSGEVIHHKAGREATAAVTAGSSPPACHSQRSALQIKELKATFKSPECRVNTV